MKIDDRKTVENPLLGGISGRVRPDGSRAPEGAPAGAATTDQVSVSDTARQLAQLRSQVGDVGEVRTARVDQLKAAVDDGTYQVDDGTVAKSFLSRVLGDLLS